MTEEDISEHQHFVLFDEPIDNSDGFIMRKLFLERGSNKIDGTIFHGYTGQNQSIDEYVDIDQISISRIKKIINAINAKIYAYFRNIQADISSLDQTGRDIAKITEKLES